MILVTWRHGYRHQQKSERTRKVKWIRETENKKKPDVCLEYGIVISTIQKHLEKENRNFSAFEHKGSRQKRF
jgi:hypothetical protein